MNKTWKRWSALLLAVVMTLSLLPTAALAAREEQAEAPLGEEVSTALLTDNASAQLMADEGPTNAADSRYDIALTADMLSTKSTRYEDWATRLLDNDASTSWEASWNSGNGTTNINFPTFAEAALEVNFTEATSVLGFRYQTKGDTNGAFVQWKIETKTTQDGEWTEAKSSDDSTKWASHTGGGWQMAKLDAAVSVYGIRLVPQSFKNGAAADAAEQTTDNTEHAGNMNSENMSCAGLRVFGTTKAAVEYNVANIDAGMFDVGFDDATGVYSNPLNNGVATEGTVIRAWASTQQANDGAAYNAVDGSTSTMWHSRWSNTASIADEENTDPNATTEIGWKQGSITDDLERRWIELDIMNGTSFGDPVLLSGLRYIRESGNGRVTKCEIRVSATENGDDWETVTSSTDWTRGDGTGWSYKQFDTPVLAKRVRLYGVLTACNGGDNLNMAAREIRLVKAESQSTETRSFTITVKDAVGSAITGATVTCASKTVSENSGTYTIADLYDGDYTVTVAKDGYKTKTLPIKVSESSTSAEATLYPPLSGDNLTAVNAHKWDYPIWATADQDASNHTVNGGSANAYSWANNGSGDDPWWAAIDGVGSDTGKMWHAFYGGSGGQDAASGNVGMWYEFTLGQKTNIIGVWVHTRDNTNSNLTSVAVRVNGTDETLTSAQWAALPAEVTTTSFTNNSWQFIELPEAVEAKQVRIYGIGASYFVAKELRVVMDPETSGAKQLTGVVQTAADGNAAIPGATVTVANRTATSADSTGAFDLGYLPVGQTYTITASAPGYATLTKDVTIPADGNFEAQELQLTPQTRSLTVTVAGNVQGATVTLLDNTANSNLPVANVASATTNESGVATLDVTYVAAGTYKLRVSHPNYDVSTTAVTLGDENATASVTLTARAATQGATQGTVTSVADLVKTYDFSTADQVNDFQALVSENGATIAYDSEKQAMKITFVDDANSYKNLILNKKFAIKNGVVEFDVTFEGTVGADDNFGSVMRYGDGKWVHVGQLNAANKYGATVHSAANQTTDFNGNVYNVALADGVTRRFCFIMGELFSGDNGYTFETTRTHLMLDSGDTGWKYTHAANALPIANDVGLWGFDAKNANGLVVYIDNIRVYRRTADKSAVTINALAAGSGTLSTKLVTELDTTTGTDLATGENAYTGDTVKISAEDIPSGKVFAVKVTKTGDANTVVTTTKQADGSYTFTMPAYPVTITPAAATELTAADVTMTGTTEGSGNQIDGNPFPTKYVRVGNTLTVTPATGVTYQWQYSSNGTDWANISGATAASFQLTTAQYNSTNSKNQVRVVVTGDGATYSGTVTSDAVDVLAALQEVTRVTFNRDRITMTYTSEDDVDGTANNATEGKTTTVTALIGPNTVSRPMTVTWTVTDGEGNAFEEGSEVIAISNPDDHATLNETTGNLEVTATLTALKAGTAKIQVTAKAKDGSTPVTSTTGITVTVLAETSSVKVYKADGSTGTTASTTEVTEPNPLVLYTNSDDDLATLNGQPNAPQRYNKFRLFADPTPADATDVADWQWVRSTGAVGDETQAGLLRMENTNGNNATRLFTVQAVGGTTSEQNVGERTILVKKTGENGPTYATFRVVVLRHLVKNVTVGYTGGATQARPGVTLEAVTSNLQISDAGVAGLTYQWYRKGTSDSEPQAIDTNGTGKTYTLIDADIGCQITVKVIATPKYGTDVDAAQRYYYEGTRTSTNAITVGKNAAPAAPELSMTAVDGTTKGTITIGNFVSTQGESYEYAYKAADATDFGNWTSVTVVEVESKHVIQNLDAGIYKVRLAANDLHEAGQEATISVTDVTKTYHTATASMATQDFQGNGSDTLTGGTISWTTQQVEDTKSVSLSVTPAEGFDILSVVDGSSQAIDATDGENGAKVYTISNVTADVSFAVTFKQKSVTISHNFTNLVCNLGNQSTNTHTVAYGSTPTIIVSLAQGVDPKAYELPERGAAGNSITTSNGSAFTNYNYDQTTGKITITGGLTEDITITGSAKPRSYAVSFTNMSNVSGPSGTQNATYGTNYTAHLTASSGYSLPDEVTVTVGGTTLAKGENTYSYDKSTGDVVIKGAAITGVITISATGVKNTTPVTGVTIVITHTHTAAGESGVTEEGTPHVGDSLRADVTPTGATVTYQWYSKGASDAAAQVITGATSQSYVVVAGDKDKVITVKVTGTGDYSSEATSTALPAVKDPTIAATGVTLNKATASIVFGATDTLTATVAPDSATDKSVTWSTSNANVATVANGVVTATGVGTATITARTANGREATCAVTVTPKDLTNDDTATVLVGGTLELGQTVTANLTPADAATDASYAWSIVDSNGDTVHSFVETGASVTIPNDSSFLGAKVQVVVTYDGNYTGHKTRITQGTIEGEVPSHSVVIATGIENGTVTADKTTAKQGETVTLTIAPANGYELDALTVTGYHDEAVTTTKEDDTHYTFIVPRNLESDGVVNVTATFKVAPVTPTTYDVTFVLNGATLNVTSGQTNNNGVVAVEEGATLTFKLTVADTTKEVKSVKVGAAPGTPITPAADGTYSIVVDAAKYVVVEVGDKTVDPGPGEDVNTAALTAAIAAANAAKEDVQTIDGKTEAEVEENVKFVTTEVMTALNNAIAAAEEALEAEDQATVDAAVETLNNAVATFEDAIKTGTKTPVDTTALKAAIKAAEDAKKGVVVAEDAATVPSNKKFVSQDDMDTFDAAIADAKEALEAGDKTDETVAAAVEALNEAVDTFNAAKQPGTKKVTPPVVVVPSEPDVIENPDGSKTTTETAPDGTVTETTEKTDGTTEVVETKPDGTVTETVTAPDGAKTEKVTTPDKAVEITVTDAEGETVAEVKLPAEITTPETRFEDVPEGHWADTAIHNVASLGLVEGVGDNKYNMDSGMTRGALATVLHRLSNKPAGSEVNFEDVANDAYYAPSVAWAAKVGVVTGFSKDTYKPDQTITREQLALMLMRYAKLLGMDVTADAAALDVFADGVNTHDWAVEGVAWCVKTGILQGKSETTLDPTANVTRAQVAVMLDRFVALMK